MKNLNFLTDLRNSNQVMTRLRPGNNQVKTTLRFIALLTLIFTLGSGNVWGALTEEYSYTFTAKQFANNTTAKTLGSITWTPATSWNSGSGYWGYDPTKGQQWGSSSNTLNTLTLTAGSSISNIKKITINASTASSGYCKLSVKVGSTAIGSEQTLTATATNYNFESATGLSGAVQIKMVNNSKAKAQYIKSITIYTEDAVTPTLTVSGDATNLAMGDAKVNGSGVTNNTLTFSGANLTANATLSITGTNAGMFSVSPTNVSKGSGTITNQTITVTYTPTSAGSHSATLTIASSGATSKTIALSGTGKYEVIWQNNGGDYETTLVASGQRPTFPDAPSSCDDGEGASTTFYGWSIGTWSGKTNDLAGKTIYTSAASMPTVTGNGTTYHAVFCKGGALTYATSIAANDVVYLATSTESGASGVTGANANGKDADVSTNQADWMPFTVQTNSTGWKLQNGTNYIQATAKNFAFTTSTPNVLTFAQEGSTGKYRMIFTSSGTNYALGDNSGSYWRFYSTANSYTWYYVLKASAGTNYMTNCCSDPGLAYATGSVTKTYGASAFTNTLTNSHSVGVTYDSSDKTVATVDSEGEVTILKAGTTTITATFAGNATYCADDASYTLTVNKANISPTLTYTPNSVAVGENSVAPTVGGNTGSGTVTYAITSASPAGCATINTNTGVVTGVAVGSVTVTATVAATDNYNGNTATATVTITAASNFPNGRTIFIQAGKSGSAWSDNACVVAWFHSYGGSETAQPTYWLFDVTAEGDDKGKKLFAAVVPSSGDLPYLDINRYASDCTTPWNKNGGVSYSDASGSNTIRSEGSGNDQVYWNLSGVTMELWSSIDSWTAKQADITDQGSGIWTGTISDYTPDATSKDFKIKTNYNGWIGNTGSNSNATLSGMVVGSTYDVTATLDIKDHSLEMSKTFVKGTVHFDLQGHGLAISDLTNVTAGSKISAPSPAPSATGWDFGGWYKDAECTDDWNFASDVVNETMTLYAKWTKHTYTITSTLNNCSSSPAIPSSYEYTGSAASLSYTITPSSGYRLPTEITVSGTTYTWNPATGALALTGTIASNVTITIVAVQTHKVDWYVGGSAPANKIGDDGQTTVVDHGGKIEDFPATTPDGTPCDKTFVGWTNTTSYTHGTSLLFTDVAGSPTINANASFYAVFATGGSTTVYLTESEISTSFVSGTTTSYGNYTITSASGTWGGKITINKVTISATDVYCVGIRKNADNNSLGSPTFSGNISNITVTGRHNAGSARDIYICSSNATAQPTSGDIGSGSIPAGPGSSVYTDWTDVSITPTGDHTSFYIYANGGLQIKTVAVTYGGYSGYTITCADCGTSVTPTYTAAPAGGAVSVTKSASPVTSGSTVKTCTAVDLTVTLTPATHYDLTGFTATGLTTGTATITPAVGSTLPVSVAQTFTVTVSAGATGTLTLAPTFTAQTPLSITLETHSKGTFTPIGDIYSGESFTFPDVTPNDPSCATFVGWIEGTTFVDDGTTHDAPVTIAAGSSSGAQSSNTTYTAVFYETETSESDAYVKVTAAPEPPATWANDHYLIVYEDAGNSYTNAVAFAGSRDNGDNGNIDATSNGIAVTIVGGNTIAATSSLAANEWRIAAVTGGYSIQSASGYYIGRAANSNGIDASNSTAYVNTIGYSDSRTNITSAGGKILKYNTAGDQLRFRYLTSAGDIQLYKLGTAVVETRTYTTNPSCTPKYRVTVASVTGGSPNANPKFNPEDTEVTLTANPAAGYSFTGWTITHTEGGAAASVTYTTGSASTETAVFEMPAYDVTVTASYAKIYVTSVVAKEGETTLNTSDHKLNISTGANKTLDVVITPSDAYDHSWTATVSAGSTYASITNVTDDGFRVNGLAQGDATITVTAPNDGDAKTVTFTVHVTDILPEEIILKRDGSSAEIETLTMYYDAANSRGQYVKVNVSYSPTPTNKNFTFTSAATGKVGSHSHSNVNLYEVLVANGVTSSPVNCTFTSAADGSVTKVLAVTVLPLLTDRFVDYIQGNATQTVSARLSADRYDIITDINTPSLSDASDADPTSADCKTAHYHMIGWLPQATAEALWAAGTAITEDTEGLVSAGATVEATGQTWYAIWAKEE